MNNYTNKLLCWYIEQRIACQVNYICSVGSDISYFHKQTGSCLIWVCSVCKSIKAFSVMSLKKMKGRKILVFQHFIFDDQLKFHAQLSWGWKMFYNLGTWIFKCMLHGFFVHCGSIYLINQYSADLIAWIYTVVATVLKFWTLLTCQKDHDKQCRSSLIRVFPVCYSDKHFVNFSTEKHFIWEQKEKGVQNLEHLP